MSSECLPTDILGFMGNRIETSVRRKTTAKRSSAAVPVVSSQAATDERDEEATLLALIGQVAAENEEALGRLYDHTISRVYGVALRIVRHAPIAEEVTSDVYMQVWRHAGRYDAARGRVMAWLLIIARSRALDHLRRQDEAFSHPDPHELSGESTPDGNDPQDLLAAARKSGRVHKALQVLTPVQRQLLGLAFFRGLTHSEIVEHTGMPLGSVKTHIRRALMVLKDHMGDANEI